MPSSAPFKSAVLLVLLLQELCCLLRSLLSVDAGARPTAATIQGAPWFSGFAWQQLRDQTLAAPPLAAAAAVTAVAAVAEVAVASG
jgi:hypothetical protein